MRIYIIFFFFSSRRRHTRLTCDWSSDVCSSDLAADRGTPVPQGGAQHRGEPRARRRRGGARPADRRAALNEEAVKLTSYFGERHRAAGRFAAAALLDLYGKHEVAASILLRGTEGFGARQRLRTDRSLTLSEDLPMIAVAVDTRARLEPLAATAARLCGTGLVTLERARL